MKEHDLMQRAVSEIRQLRQQNQHMRTRLEMFDDCMLLLTAQVRQQGGGMSPDICQEIERHVEQTKPTSTP